MRLYLRRASIAGLLLLTIAGCQSESDPVYPVSGKVTFPDGSPARFGIIEFRRELPTTVVARGKIQRDGTFRVRSSGSRSGLTQGNHKAIIIQVVGTHRTDHIHHDHGQIVADKYRDYNTTELSVDVSPDGKNHFEIVAERKGLSQN